MAGVACRHEERASHDGRLLRANSLGKATSRRPVIFGLHMLGQSAGGGHLRKVDRWITGDVGLL